MMSLLSCFFFFDDFTVSVRKNLNLNSVTRTHHICKTEIQNPKPFGGSIIIGIFEMS